MLLLFGSQTGNACEIAKQIDVEAKRRDPVRDTRCQSMQEYIHQDPQLEALVSEPLVVFVISTTGQGDPPDNARKFMRTLRKKDRGDTLAAVRFAVLGLGDSNYDQFNAAGKNLRKILKQRGAVEFHDMGAADDAIGLGSVVEPWKEGLHKAIARSRACLCTDKVCTDTPCKNRPAAVQQVESEMRAPPVAMEGRVITNITCPRGVDCPAPACVFAHPWRGDMDVKEPKDPWPGVLVLFGSQTGNAEEIAKMAQAELVRIGDDSARVMAMSEFVASDPTLATLPNEKLVLFVVSTTGQGDPPDNARKFLRVLRKQKDKRLLEGVMFAVLGLGDSNYDKFNAAGKSVQKMMKDRGATEFYAMGAADDGVGLDDVVDPWTKGLYKLVGGARNEVRSSSAADMDEDAIESTLGTPSKLSTAAAAAAAAAVAKSPSRPMPTPVLAPVNTARPTAAPPKKRMGVRCPRWANCPSKTCIFDHPPKPVAKPVVSVHPSWGGTLVLYGSQTGNAEEIAKMAQAEIARRGDIRTRVMSMNDYVAKDPSLTGLPAEKLVVFVVATTGDGDPPDNARKFLRVLRKQKDKQLLSSVRFAVLGLGDSNYDKFNAAAKSVQKIMKDRGARPFYDIGAADDAVGLDVVVEPWTKGVFDAVQKILAVECQSYVDAAKRPAPNLPAAEEEHNDEDGPVPENRVMGIPCPRGVNCPSKACVFAHPYRPGVAQVTPAEMPATAATAAAESKAAGTSTSTLPAAPAPPPAPTPAPASAIDTEKGGAAHLAIPNGNNPTATSSGPSSDAGEDEDAVPRVKVPKPKGLPRLRPCGIALKYGKAQGGAPAAAMQPYVARRWPTEDVEEEMRGFSPEAPCFARLERARLLTSPDCKDRRVVHIELELPPRSMAFVPGDSFGVYCPNPADAVDRILARLKLDGDTVITDISALQTPRAGNLSHIVTPCTLREVFTYCVDITSPPRKGMLRMLASKCQRGLPSFVADRTRLYHLCSRGGSEDYMRDIMLGKPGLQQILDAFPSCQPPPCHLLDLLPPLQPRYYSIASSPSEHPTTIHAAFTVVDVHLPGTFARQHKGLATNWLERLCQTAGLLEEDDQALLQLDVDEQAREADLLAVGGCIVDQGRPSLPIFVRKTAHFTLPSDTSKPVIMVGPGTGVAPFRGFLQHRRSQQQAITSGGCRMGWWRGLEVDEQDEQNLSYGSNGGSRWSPEEAGGRYMMEGEEDEEEGAQELGSALLFFGCRRADHDFLYKDDFEMFVDEGVLTELHTAFSRDPSHPAGSEKMYVQVRMKEQAASIARTLLYDKGYLFVCGDGSTMAKGVQKTVTDIIAKYGCMSTLQAHEYVQSLLKQGRYVQDIWC